MERRILVEIAREYEARLDAKADLLLRSPEVQRLRGGVPLPRATPPHPLVGAPETDEFETARGVIQMVEPPVVDIEAFVTSARGLLRGTEVAPDSWTPEGEETPSAWTLVGYLSRAAAQFRRLAEAGGVDHGALLASLADVTDGMLRMVLQPATAARRDAEAELELVAAVSAWFPRAAHIETCRIAARIHIGFDARVDRVETVAAQIAGRLKKRKQKARKGKMSR